MVEAVVLAAGRGSRLEGLTADRPKPMVEVGGMTLIERAVRALREAGIDEVKLVVGYRAEAFSFLSLPCFNNPDWAQSGIFRSLLCAAPLLEASLAIVCYGDIFFEASDVARLAATGGDIVVAYDPAASTLWSKRFTEPLADLENFILGADGRCIRIGGRLERDTRLDGQFTGLFKLSPRGWAALCRTAKALPQEMRQTIDMTSLLSRALAAGVVVEAMPLEGKWGEVDQPSDVKLYERLYFQVGG